MYSSIPEWEMTNNGLPRRDKCTRGKVRYDTMKITDKFTYFLNAWRGDNWGMRATKRAVPNSVVTTVVDNQSPPKKMIGKHANIIPNTSRLSEARGPYNLTRRSWENVYIRKLSLKTWRTPKKKNQENYEKMRNRFLLLKATCSPCFKQYHQAAPSQLKS